jgi:lysophospholipase L1-like esterase
VATAFEDDNTSERPPGAVMRVLSTLREREGRLVVADMRAHGPRSWRRKLAADKFHPNDAGYAAMARVFDVALGLEGAR